MIAGRSRADAGRGVRSRRINANGLGPEGVRAKAVLMSKVSHHPHPDTYRQFSERRLTDRYEAQP